MIGLVKGSSSSVVTYTVHEPPAPQADRIDRADELRFIRDGFSWPAAIFPPLGLAMKGLWTAAVAYLVFMTAAVAGLHAIGVNDDLVPVVVLALNVYLGFEASTLERWSLDNDGWQMLGAVTGRDIADCERRFFENWMPSQPLITHPGSATAGLTAKI
jgi:hypothetical protein